MFTVEQIHEAHLKVKSGADFPAYIQEIKALGVQSFETWVSDSHITYWGENGYSTQSASQYEPLTIVNLSDTKHFVAYLQSHQQGETDYVTFCLHCATTGIEKWIVDLTDMTCIYYDIFGNEVWKEQIPT